MSCSNMMSGSGGAMMIAMAFEWVLLALLQLLAIAALIKFLRNPGQRE